ncbi:MAG TPA: HD domain-containing protein [Flavisolibacter sp.]
MQFDKAYLFLTTQLEEGLPRWLTYHNVQHTKEVVEAAQYLAMKEGISHYEYLLLSTAAAFHDAGFLEGYDDHEAISCKIATTHLPSFGYTDDEIEAVCKLIMVTKAPQTPQTHLEEILCDADLHYLGTDKYAPISENLFLEFMEVGIVKNREEWNEKQSSFLQGHRYFTQTAIAEYAQKKEENCRNISAPDLKDD